MAATDPELRAAQLGVSGTRALKALADAGGQLSRLDLASALGVSVSTVDRLGKRLTSEGLIAKVGEGRHRLWSLNAGAPRITRLSAETTPTDAESSGASPYATGGGGVRLEHLYAACLVAQLLANEAVPELGDAIRLERIRLQASDISPVDDIVVEGADGDGNVRRASIAVRRSPKLTSSDAATVPLVRAFLRTLVEHWADVSAGRWHLVLAVSTYSNAVTELSELAELSHTLPDSSALAARLEEPGRTNARLRARHRHLLALVEQAINSNEERSGVGTEALAWRLLSSLRVRQLRLERTDRSDRTTAVNALHRTVLRGDDSATRADALFTRIEELVGRWAPQAAVLDEAVIRRHLPEFAIAASPQFGYAWQTLIALGEHLRESVSPNLAIGAQSLELPRHEEHERLGALMHEAASTATVLVVTGDPDVGKSALALRVLESLSAEGATTVALSLRDLPESWVDLRSALGGASLLHVLEGAKTSPAKLLLVDGAEAALEGRAPLLLEVATAAMRAGFGVAAVTRTDGEGQAKLTLEQASVSASAPASPTTHVVAALAPAERAQVAEAFVALARVRHDQRASWLLGRPGLVAALLRTGRPLDPEAALCEADVFSAFWRSVVRNGETRAPDGASPDDRDHTAIAVAQQQLGIASAPIAGTAAAELRSAGVLRTPMDASLTSADSFASDLLRDFALCRLFITSHWSALHDSSAPRWSVRAARMACQAALLAIDPIGAWRQLTSEFNALALDSGDRWRDLPYEALLTMSDAEPLLTQLWHEVCGPDSDGRTSFLRLAHARFVDGGVGDVHALRPLVRLAFVGEPHRRREGPHFHGAHTALEALVLAWLKGMILARRGTDAVRVEIREDLLLQDPSRYGDFELEVLALLDADLDDRVDAVLRTFAATRPGRLHDVVESAYVAASMAEFRPALLLHLAEAYYIEKAEPGEWGSRHGPLDDGIRSYSHGGGFGAPMAAWYLGPFYRLLQAAPLPTIAFINRMLDHAASFRMKDSAPLDTDLDDRQAPGGVILDFDGTGGVNHVGDSHVWSWYRGTGVGPYPCVSALLALEKYCDFLFEQAEIPATTIHRLLLQDCHNLALPGMFFGFLIRHQCTADGLLDPYLTEPAVWHLEFSRVMSDYSIHVRDAEADTRTGSDRRRQNMHQTVAKLVVEARLANDHERLAHLRALGERLLRAAQAHADESETDSTEYLATVGSWAAEFDIANYRATPDGDHVLIEFERPAAIAEVLDTRTPEMERINSVLRLQNRYATHNDHPELWPMDSLLADLARARRLDEENEITPGDISSEDGLVAVAAAAVRAVAHGLATIDADDLGWAIDAVMRAAEPSSMRDTYVHSSRYPMGADRAAAIAVPLLTLAAFDAIAIDRARLHRCLTALATSPYDEVRAAYATGCESVWPAACRHDHDDAPCARHHPLWASAMTGLADCRLGDWDQHGQKRLRAPLQAPYADSLRHIPAEDLLVVPLRMPLVCMSDARAAACLRDEVQEMWEPLWAAHLRAFVHHSAQGYDHGSSDAHAPIARRLIDLAIGSDRAVVADHIAACATNAKALSTLFDGFATAFTYSAPRRSHLGQFWNWALDAALEAIGDGTVLRADHHWVDYAVASLLPTPTPTPSDPDIDATLAECRISWLAPADLDECVAAWLQLARSEPKAVDAVISYAKTAPIAWQTTVALQWIEELIDNRFDLFANHLWFLDEWLLGIRPQNPPRDRYHRIVDGLARAGDRGAVRLQLLDE